MRHSHRAMYLAAMSPSPACSIRMGARASTSVSSSIPWGARLNRVIFT